jgi:hypothetical protein
MVLILLWRINDIQDHLRPNVLLLDIHAKMFSIATIDITSQPFHSAREASYSNNDLLINIPYVNNQV